MDKNKICESYDKIVDWYDANRDKTLMEIEYLNLIIDAIPAEESYQKNYFIVSGRKNLRTGGVIFSQLKARAALSTIKLN